MWTQNPISHRSRKTVYRTKRERDKNEWKMAVRLLRIYRMGAYCSSAANVRYSSRQRKNPTDDSEIARAFSMVSKGTKNIAWVSTGQKIFQPKPWEPVGEWLLLPRFQRMELPKATRRGGNQRTWWGRRTSRRPPLVQCLAELWGKGCSHPYNVKWIAPPAYHSSLGKLLCGLNPAKPWGQGCPGYVQEVGTPAPVVNRASS